jgi:hypothetical protein
MRKAFDANVPKLRPRLRQAMVDVLDTTPEAQDETDLSTSQSISENITPVPADLSNPDPVNTSDPILAVNEISTPLIYENTQSGVDPQNQKDEHIALPGRHKTIAHNIIQFPDSTLRNDDIEENNEGSQDTCNLQIPQTPHKDQSTVLKITEFIQTDTIDEPVQSTESLKDFAIDTQPGVQDTASYRSTTISPSTPVLPIDDSDTRRKRLEEVKRKVAQAVRPEVRIEPVPEDPALAVESVLGLVRDLETQLSRSRDLEKALRIDLAEVKAELARTVNDGSTASGRLVQAEAQLDEKRNVLEEMLFEMGALEEERDQAVRMVQMLTAQDVGRQRDFDDLGHRYAKMEQALDDSKVEEGRLTDELDESIAENARLHTLLTEITRERDNLARNAEQLIRERDELAEARKSLEKVHQALSQARARLRE